jgi:[acyl-carrier-protein] S-malonyltransferase
VVISGSRELLREFARMIKERNLGKCKELFVAGPWHSGFMQSAREAFEVWAEPLVFHKPRIPLILNATAQGESHPSTIKHLITWQLTSPVYWRECMETVRRAGVSTFLEIGPGRVLSGLVRVNGYERTAEVFNISNLRGVESAANVVTHQSASDKPGCVQ